MMTMKSLDMISMHVHEIGRAPTRAWNGIEVHLAYRQWHGIEIKGGPFGLGWPYDCGI
jgi:hypothetical protein